MLQQRVVTARKVMALLTCLSYLLICADALLLPRFSSVIDRNEFLSIVIVSTGQLIPSSWFVEKQLQHDDSSSVIIPLRFLPVGGSWAIKIFVANNDERDDKYYAVVDTGSPFLTVPSSLASVTERTTYPMTKEQYGQDISEMDWKKIPYVTILTNSSVIDTENLVVGMEETQQPNQEAGSAFAGLVNIDDNRPTFLEQLTRERISAFTISFARNYLQLSQRSLIDKRNPAAFPLVDLRPYGPDLYHYAVDCESLKIRWNDGVTESILASNLQRPVWLVLDTGLTGCVFSDSLMEELHNRRGNKDVVPDGISVSTVSQSRQPLVLTSSDQYWVFSSFRLPWFRDVRNHPHIVALGCTFWTQCESLTVDMASRTVKIIPRQPTV